MVELERRIEAIEQRNILCDLFMQFYDPLKYNL